MMFGSRAHAYACAKAYITTGYEYPTLRPFEATKEQCKHKKQLHVPRAFCSPTSSTSSLDPNCTSYGSTAVDTSSTRSQPVEVPAQGRWDTSQLVQSKRTLALAPGTRRAADSGYNGPIGGPSAEARSARARAQGLPPSADSQGAVGGRRSPRDGRCLGVPDAAAPCHLGRKVAVGPYGDGSRSVRCGQPRSS